MTRQIQLWEQMTNDGSNIRQPLGFFSKKLTPTQTQWSTYDRQLFAIYTAVEHFEYLGEGREVVLVTDYKPLLAMFVKKRRMRLERQARQIEYISQFAVHVSGVLNKVADALSRPESEFLAPSMRKSENNDA